METIRSKNNAPQLPSYEIMPAQVKEKNVDSPSYWQAKFYNKLNIKINYFVTKDNTALAKSLQEKYYSIKNKLTPSLRWALQQLKKYNVDANHLLQFRVIDRIEVQEYISDLIYLLTNTQLTPDRAIEYLYKFNNYSGLVQRGISLDDFNSLVDKYEKIAGNSVKFQAFLYLRNNNINDEKLLAEIKMLKFDELIDYCCKNDCSTEQIEKLVILNLHKLLYDNLIKDLHANKDNRVLKTRLIMLNYYSTCVNIINKYEKYINLAKLQQLVILLFNRSVYHDVRLGMQLVEKFKHLFIPKQLAQFVLEVGEAILQKLKCRAPNDDAYAYYDKPPEATMVIRFIIENISDKKLALQTMFTICVNLIKHNYQDYAKKMFEAFHGKNCYSERQDNSLCLV